MVESPLWSLGARLLFLLQPGLREFSEHHILRPHQLWECWPGRRAYSTPRAGTWLQGAAGPQVPATAPARRRMHLPWGSSGPPKYVLHTGRQSQPHMPPESAGE